MQHLLRLSLLCTLLLGACTPGTSATQLTANPSDTPISLYTPIPSQTPTIAATVAASPTATTTLSPDPMIYEFDSSIGPADQALVRQGVEMARRYLIDNFGSDLLEPHTILVRNMPNDLSPEGATNFVAGRLVILENIGSPLCRGDYPSRCLFSVIFETTHLWQSEQGSSPSGCLSAGGFLVEGQSGYVANMALGIPVGDGDAQAMWRHSQYDESALFDSSTGGAAVVKHLVDKFGGKAFTRYCTAVGNGMSYEKAFQSVYGLSTHDFQAQFKAAALGNEASCTPASCGDQGTKLDARYGSLAPLVDRTLSAPNLIIKFTDQEGRPVKNINLQLARFLYNDLRFTTSGEDTTTNADGVLAIPVLPGTYGMRFCSAGYPALGNGYSGDTTNCVYELRPFDVAVGETKTIDFQYRSIEDTTLQEPNFIFTLLGIDGQPISNGYVQICGYDAVSNVCLNGKTDTAGIFKASLKDGQYFIRLVQPGQGDMDARGHSNPRYGMNLDPYHRANLIEYQVTGIEISTGTVKSLSYQFPVPNLKISFALPTGGLAPNTYFYLCKVPDPATAADPASSVERSLTDEIMARTYAAWDKKVIKAGSFEGDCFLLDHTDSRGVFQIHVEPGKYLMLFDGPGDQYFEHYFDHLLSDIVVTGDELTSVSYQFK